MKDALLKLGKIVFQRNRAPVAVPIATPVVELAAPVVESPAPLPVAASNAAVANRGPSATRAIFDPAHSDEQRADAIIRYLARRITRAFANTSLVTYFHAHDRAMPPYKASSMTVYNNARPEAGEIGLDFAALEDNGEPGFRLSKGSPAFGDFLPLRTINADTI